MNFISNDKSRPCYILHHLIRGPTRESWNHSIMTTLLCFLFKHSHWAPFRERNSSAACADRKPENGHSFSNFKFQCKFNAGLGRHLNLAIDSIRIIKCLSYSESITHPVRWGILSNFKHDNQLSSQSWVYIFSFATMNLGCENKVRRRVFVHLIWIFAAIRSAHLCFSNSKHGSYMDVDNDQGTSHCLKAAVIRLSTANIPPFKSNLGGIRRTLFPICRQLVPFLGIHSSQGRQKGMIRQHLRQGRL